MLPRYIYILNTALWLAIVITASLHAHYNHADDEELFIYALLFILLMIANALAWVLSSLMKKDNALRGAFLISLLLMLFVGIPGCFIAMHF